MSIAIHSNSGNKELDNCNCLYRNFQTNTGYTLFTPFIFPCYEDLHAVDWVSRFASVPYYPDYTWITESRICLETNCQYQTCDVNVSKLNVTDERNYENKEGMVKIFNDVLQEKREESVLMENERKSNIWRPFSPTPSSQTNNTAVSNIHKQSTRGNYKNTLFNIKPSNVKIGASKTSVFKAVKKSTYFCSQCSTRYLSNRQLNNHIRAHSGFKPFHCDYLNCFKSFARNEELTRHKRIHSGFKPHICMICKKRFGRKDHLSKHQKTHLETSEKKVYVCSISGCGHRYTRSDALTRHKTTAHAIKSTKAQ